MKRFETVSRDHKNKKQRKVDEFIAALLTHPTLEAAAHAIGISRITAWRWLKDSDFLSRIREARREHIRQITSKLQASAQKSLDTLDELQSSAENESVRLGAARVILEQSLRAADTEDVHLRLDILEQAIKQQKGTTTDDRQERSRAAGTPGNINGRAQ
jgi:hypothetical protein